MTGPKNAMAGHLPKGAPPMPEWLGRDGTIETQELSLGLCECPGRPHAAGDVATVRKRLTYGDVLVVIAAGETGVLGLASAHMVVRTVASWNLTRRDADGQDVPLPIDLQTVSNLSPAQGMALSNYAQELDMSVALPKDGDPRSQGGLEGDPTSPTSTGPTPT